MMRLFLTAGLALGIAVAATQAEACASCGCTLSSDWENLNLSGQSGFRLDLRYDDLNQNDLRSGTHRISPVAASGLITAEGDPYEIENYTRNHYTTLMADYATGTGWGVNLQLPYVQRDHETLGEASDGVTGGPDGGQYRSSSGNLGDVRLVGRFQGFSGNHNIGLMFGLKLPTGAHDLTGVSTDPGHPGPVAIDRGLQPGTGTTDLILGAYYARPLSRNYDLFVQTLYQHALNSKDDYRPGDGYNFNIGLKYLGFDHVTPQLQLNARYVRPDSGAEADTVSTGGTLVYLSPGVTVPVSKRAALYLYAQMPVYQDVRGVQLTTKASLSAGLRYTF